MLKRGNVEVKISKRSGDMVTLRELVEEVGADACRFVFLSRSADSQMDFDIELAKKQSADNPVYYVQYAHARISSILRLAQEKGIDFSQGNVALLTTEAELDLIRKMLQLPEVVETVAAKLEPHHLPYYAQDLATAFHSLLQAVPGGVRRCGADRRAAEAGGRGPDRLRPHALLHGHERARPDVAECVGRVERSETRRLTLDSSTSLAAICCVPNPGIESSLDEQPECTVLPLAGRLCQPMLNRIVVNVIAMGIEVHIVTNAVFPELLLPNALLSFPEQRRRDLPDWRTLRAREKPAFTSLHLVEKSWSPSGIVQMQRRWFGMITMASTVKGWRAITSRNDLSRVDVAEEDARRGSLRKVTTVKK